MHGAKTYNYNCHYRNRIQSFCCILPYLYALRFLLHLPSYGFCIDIPEHVLSTGVLISP